MIIVEGPNKCGKTTLAKEFKDYKSLYIRAYDKDNGDELWYSSLTQVEKFKQVIVDRCWLTEAIYHKICRLRLDQLYYLSLLTEARSGLMLILLPPMIELARRGGKLYEKPDGSDFPLAELWNRYNLLQRNRLFIKTIDGYKVRLDHLLPSKTMFFTKNGVFRPSQIRTLARTLSKERELYRTGGWCGVGSMNPKILLMADKVNPNVSKDIHHPPLLPAHQSHAGAYLMRVLYHSGIDLRLIHIHNAYKPSGRPYRRSLIQILDPDIMIALGKVGKGALKSYYNQEDIGEIPHPQYLRRFKTGQEETYGEMLRDNIKYHGGLAKHFTRRNASS